MPAFAPMPCNYMKISVNGSPCGVFTRIHSVQLVESVEPKIYKVATSGILRGSSVSATCEAKSPERLTLRTVYADLVVA